MPWPAELNHLPARHLRALVNCDAVSEELPLVVDGSRRPNPAMAEHLRTCLRCQAELAGYRRLIRVLRSLRDEPVAFPPPDLVGNVMMALQERVGPVSGQGVVRHRKPSGTWLIAGVVAGAGVAVLGARAVLARSTRGSRAAATF